MSEWAEPSTGHAQAAEREEAGPSAGSRPGAGRRRGGAECRDAAQEYSPRTGRPPRGGGRALQWFLPRGRAKGVAGEKAAGDFSLALPNGLELAGSGRLAGEGAPARGVPPSPLPHLVPRPGGSPAPASSFLNRRGTAPAPLAVHIRSPPA